jgi:HD-like signal output (HDOD) protein
MAATLIRNANGARFAGDASRWPSAGQAMNRLGLRQTAAIMTGFLARHAMPVRSPQLQGFWERSSRRALAMGASPDSCPACRPTWPTATACSATSACRC